MENLDAVISSLQNFGAFKGTLKTNEPLAQKSTFKIGADARLFIAPQNLNSLQKSIELLEANQVQFFIIGGASNLVFPDTTYNGAILSTENFSGVDFFPVENLPPSFNITTLPENKVLISCFSGTRVSQVVEFCTQNNLSGFEQFAGLPGTIGGAVYMNARCFEKSISDLLFSTSWIDFSTTPSKLSKSLFKSEEWDYKKSPFQNSKKLLTTATFLLEQKSQSEHSKIEVECKKYIEERRSKGHFNFPSAGSVFKNNHDFGAPSGKLIDQCNLKGTQIGGAQIAPFHGNFIININHATQADVKALVQLAQKEVKNKFGFTLENEIIFVENKI